MAERGKTKERILEESLKLFSVHGFDAVSIRSIADAVGIGNSALYKHFKSKQEIFDTLVDISKERYIRTCSYVIKDQIRGVEQVKKIIMTMFHFQTSDEWIIMFRRMLILEQFKNPQMAAIYKEFFIDIPLQTQQAIFKELMRVGFMKENDPEVVAMEFYAPMFMYHTVKRDEKELKELFDKHAEYFFENNKIGEKKNES